MGIPFTPFEIERIEKGVRDGLTARQIHALYFDKFRSKAGVQSRVTRYRAEIGVGVRARQKLINMARTYVHDKDMAAIDSVVDKFGVPAQRVIRAAIKLGLSQVESHHLLPGGLADE